MSANQMDLQHCERAKNKQVSMGEERTAQILRSRRQQEVFADFCPVLPQKHGWMLLSEGGRHLQLSKYRKRHKNLAKPRSL